MKKHSLLKTIGICFLILVILTWIIPAGKFYSGKFSSGETNPIGLFDLFRYPILTLGTFAQFGVAFLVIGGLYGVISKTGAYAPFIDRVAKKWKGKEQTFLTIVIIFFALLASLTGLSLPLFVFVPLFIALILAMGMKKTTAIASTVGAILVGLLGATYGFNIVGYVDYFLALNINNQIAAKIFLLIILVFLLNVFVHQAAKKELLVKQEKPKKVTDKKEPKTKKKETKKETKSEEKKEEVIVVESKDIPFYDNKNQNKKSLTPILIILGIVMIFIFIGMYNWYHAFKITIFQDAYTSLMGVKIFGYPIIANLLGSVSQFGYWSNYEFVILILICTLLIGWIYSLKTNEILEGFVEGAKKMIGVAFYATICSVLFTVLLSGGDSGSIYDTVINFLIEIPSNVNSFFHSFMPTTGFIGTIASRIVSGITGLFMLFTSLIIGLFGGFLYNDFYYLLSSVYDLAISNYDAKTLTVIGLLLQTMHGFAMLLFPTSIILVAGLKFTDTSYKEWIKYIWKFLLSAFAVIMIILVIAYLFI